MKSLVFVLASSGLVVFLGACQATKSVFERTVKVDEKILQEQKAAIEVAETSLEAQNWAVAEEQFSVFMRKYPVSSYSAQAYFGKARSLEGLGQYQAAVQVYRTLGEQARKTSPEQAAMAYVRMSYCYEALGDETRLMAALADADSFAEALPEEVRQLEIPTRRAASMMRRGLADEARKILKQVEKNLPDVSERSSLELRSKHARILTALGAQDLRAITPENYIATLETVQALQPFLWKAVTLKATPWSDQAAEKLRLTYFTLANLAFNPPKLDAGRSESVSARYRSELQKTWVARLLESLENLKTFSTEALSEAGGELPQLVGEIEENGRKILWGRQNLTPLTDESKVHHQLKKEVRLVSPPELADPSDPNLQEGRP